jgi:hypothetical protein
LPEPPPSYPEERSPLPESEPDSPNPTFLIEEPKPGEPLRIIEQPTSDVKLLFAVCAGLVAALIAVIFSTL